MYRHPVETLTVPWVNLLLTCKSVNTELAAYMSSPLILGDESLRTYTMDIYGTNDGVLRSSTWHGIPCAPSNADAVLVNIHIEYGWCYWRVRTWGNGGPMPILRQLYQTLNLMLHNGPILSRASPLEHPLKLKNLNVHVTAVSGSIPDPPHTDDGFKPPDTGIKCRLVTLKDVGLLQGYVDHVHISDERGHTELAIEAVDNTGVPTFWDRYGFEWGPNHSDSVKWETFDEKCPANPRRRV
ncbi:hypothetical protein F5B21DRAFT_496492 [Xylaria acuta]|nr:hypothetical protein F5B21DRAFT_496492 [Xylaria acuta]